MNSQHCLSVWFVGVASPPVRCSNTGLKKINQKSQISYKTQQCAELLLSSLRINRPDIGFTGLSIMVSALEVSFTEPHLIYLRHFFNDSPQFLEESPQFLVASPHFFHVTSLLFMSIFTSLTSRRGTWRRGPPLPRS